MTTNEAILTAGALLLLTRRSTSKMNPNPFQGQIWSKNEAFDNEVLAIAGRLDVPANWLFFNMYRESGLNPLAHVNTNGGKYVFGLKDKASVGPNTWGGGLFGLVRPYHKPYTGGLSLEEWILSGEMNQLKGFELWLKPMASRIHDPGDIRLAGFAPAYLGKPDSQIVYKDPQKSYTVHAYLDTNDDGKLTLGELKELWLNQYNKAAKRAEKKGPLRVK